MTGHEPKHCSECGKALKHIESKDTWSCLHICPEGHMFETLYGDYMGGGSDSTHSVWKLSKRQKQEYDL